MSSDIDPNKLVVEFINSNLDRLATSIGKGVKGTKDRVRAKVKRTYKPYLERTVERHSRSKSFFIRSEAKPIYEFFVPPDLSHQKQTFLEPGAPELEAVTKAAVVTGTAGCGKTMFLRHLLISALKAKERVPVFLELRQLNRTNDSVRSTILSTLIAHRLDVDDEYLELALEAGHFLFLLDGFDEVELRERERVFEEIHSLVVSYPDNTYVVSSRPDPTLEGWHEFSLFQIQPLDLDKAVRLVSKLPFDEAIKEKFVGALKAGLYVEHKSFLANPLLLSIMLLTYTDIAHIPNKLSIFYNQAYESLFQKHDALKGGFQRPRRTSLDVLDFARAFSAFCVQSYDKREFSFSRSKALEYFDKSKKLLALEFDSSGMLDDTIQAVCLMVEDGLEISFAHRSFQEYFVARFIGSLPPQEKERLVTRFAPNIEHDSVLQLLFEMDQFSVEKYFILPGIEKFKEAIKLKRNIGVTHVLRYIKLVFAEFVSIVEDGKPELHATIHSSYWIRFLLFIRQNYGAHFGDQVEEKEVRDGGAAFLASIGKRSAVSTSSIKTTDKFFRTIYEDGNIWSRQFLARILKAGESIRMRHHESMMSLEEVLKH